MVDGNEAAGKILASDANGVGTWTEFSTLGLAGKIDDLADGKSDTSSIYLGFSAGANDDGNNNNVGLGYQSLKNNTSGILNTGIGYLSLYS